MPGRLRRTVKPVGRLDVQTEGLLLLTDDGDLARSIAHAFDRLSQGVTRSRCRESLGGEAREASHRLRARRRAYAAVRDRSHASTPRRKRRRANTWLRVTLREGRTRQIRRMFEAIGHPVSKLRRVAIGPIRDPHLTPGALRRLSTEKWPRCAGWERSPDPPASDRGHRRPLGAGKSTVARALAARLGVPYIDTGAMYRAIGLAAQRRGVRFPSRIRPPWRGRRGARIELAASPEGTPRLFSTARTFPEIRKPEISAYASAVSAIPAVRRVLVVQQQRMGGERGGVMEGRDIGTKSFPRRPSSFPDRGPRNPARPAARELAGRGTPQSYGRSSGTCKNATRTTRPGRIPPSRWKRPIPGRGLQRTPCGGGDRRHRTTGAQGDLTPIKPPIGYCFASQRLMRGESLI
jgi:cytidylate kinase